MRKRRLESHAIGDRQAQHRQEEYRDAVRALLMRPLMTSDHPNFSAVRRHADRLRTWFARETGWPLAIERDCARLYKRPADLSDATRGLPGFDRRRYVLLCLAAAVLERAEPQITLRVLGDRLLILAGEPALAERGFAFGLENAHERRELVAVCRALLDWGVIARVAGDEDAYVLGHEGRGGDALYDIHRRVLAGLLAAVRGPSTWAPEDVPCDLDQRLAALVAEHQPESDEGRRTALRHQFSRRLLDDPVIYFDELDAENRAYFLNQRGLLATRLSEDSGLVAEQRAEGVALVDETGDLTDVALPAEGTESHVTLLVARFLANRRRESGDAVTEAEIVGFIRTAAARYGQYWRKSAREPGGERELTKVALSRLAMLRLIGREEDAVHPLPALARIGLGEATVKTQGGEESIQLGMFP
ncbi:TIGR02678 family protein [Methylococcus sp. Mc7]|uniref:TIGR02678 family protein n=1 Tax=Methylococcus sp. Mc7 TaxID=2860258 RepID=UPI001C530E1A|nr:TIGR02678 family protein [Methylococcus sp. Mc7]QXP85027.1 TIGR02678 family protein [Methylococcus sp. Mc7]